MIARFEDYAGLFSYHCHILEHEDHEMMRQFNAVTDCSDGADNDGDLLFDYPADPECTSPHDLSETEDCGDGLDNDGDGLADVDDPGCSSVDDLSEKDLAEPCDDGIDNDGDGRIDFDIVTFSDDPTFQAGLGDPGCGSPNWGTESPQCQDGLNNDAKVGIDFDRGASATGQILSAEPDPQCNGLPWKAVERAPSSCSAQEDSRGIAQFIVISMLLLAFLRATRRRRDHAERG